MKLDKETFVKHQFWFLLGGYLLIWLIAVFTLKFAAAEPIENAEKAYKASKTKLDSAKRSPKNPKTFNPPWEEYGTVFNKHKQVIWGKAWELQKGMYDWPFSFDVETPQTEISQDDREKYKRELYPEEVKKLQDAIPELLGPVELAGGFQAVFKPQKWEKDQTPSREECWLTQEDFWVKRELLVVVSDTVAREAYMFLDKIDKEKEPQPEDVVARYRYRNQDWEITLLIKESKDKDKKGLVISRDSTIKNVHPGGRVQRMASAKGEGIVFNVYQGKTFQRFELKGEPVPFGSAPPFGSDYALSGIEWTNTKQPPQMSQAFDRYTCPIRRVNAIEIGQQSCRTYTTALKPNDTLVQLDAPPGGSGDNAANALQKPGGGMMGAPPGAVPGMPPAPAGGTAATAPGGMRGGPSNAPPGMTPGGMMGMRGGPVGPPPNPTPNNEIDRNRYLQPPKEGNEVEKPSRHLPLALQLVVDQANMHDVLLAMANSRLRIQITQVEFHRLRDGLSPADGDKNGVMLRTGAVYMPPGMDQMYRRSPRGMGMPPGQTPPGMTMGRMATTMPGMNYMGGAGGMPPPGRGGRPAPPPNIVAPSGMGRPNPRGPRHRTPMIPMRKQRRSRDRTTTTWWR